MAIRTHVSRSARALDFLSKDSIYFSLGKTSPWTEGDYTQNQPIPANPEDNPPLENPQALSLQETIGYKKAGVKFIVEPVSGGQIDGSDTIIDYLGVKWRVVPSGEVFTSFATHVYVETIINPDDFPLGPYRQVGLFSGLVPLEGITSDVLLPSEVDEIGSLEVLDNRIVSTRQEGVQDKLSYILKF